jgi:hypothetical protein
LPGPGFEKGDNVIASAVSLIVFDKKTETEYNGLYILGKQAVKGSKVASYARFD